jgi:hypothetical protein
VKVLASDRRARARGRQEQAAAAGPQNSLTVEVTLEEAEKLARHLEGNDLRRAAASDVDIVQQNVDRPTDVGVLIGYGPTKDARRGSAGRSPLGGRETRRRARRRSRLRAARPIA